MRILKSQPKTWQELQDIIGQLFLELGCQVELSKVVNLVRGKKEIDVFVQDQLSDNEPIILIECKYWIKKVNQEIIHSFRTVVNDFGANYGFIVSKNGFQKGSYEAVEKTNISLLTLDDIEEKYSDRWIVSMTNKYLPLSDQLLRYWDPYENNDAKDGTKIDWNLQELLYKAYEPIIKISRVDNICGFQRNFPMIIPVINDEFITTSNITINDERDYFDFVELYKNKAIRHYKKLYKEI